MASGGDKPTVTERLMVGARSLLADEGVGALTARGVAAASGRSTMCVYTAFGSVSRMVETLFEQVSAECVAAVSGAANPVRGYLDWASENPRAYHLLFELDLAGSGIEPAQRRDVVAQVQALLRDNGDPATLWALLHGTVVLRRIDGDLAPTTESDLLASVSIAAAT